MNRGLALGLAAFFALITIWLPGRYGQELLAEYRLIRAAETETATVLRKIKVHTGPEAVKGANGAETFLLGLRYEAEDGRPSECDLVVDASRYSSVRPGDRIRLLVSGADAASCLLPSERAARAGRFLLIVAAVAVNLLVAAGFLRAALRG